MKRELPPFVYLRKGRYAYFERGGVCQRMPEPGTPEFHHAYAKLIGGAKKEHVGPRTFAALMKDYRNSKRFKALKPRTQADYEKVMALIERKIGKLPVAAMKTKDVIRAQNDVGGRLGNYLVSVLSLTMEHARRIGWVDINPARSVEKMPVDGINRKPWPDDMLSAFRAAATKPRPRLVFELCLCTGQRIGDVLKMRWDHIEDGGVWVTQGKTKRRLYIPLTPTLARTLAETPRDGLTIVTGVHGRPASYRVVADEIMAVRRAIGAEAYDIHALRHTTAAHLAAAGHDDETIKAITGHASTQMVARYAGQARQITRAKKAQEGRE